MEHEQQNVLLKLKLSGRDTGSLVIAFSFLQLVFANCHTKSKKRQRKEESLQNWHHQGE